MTQVSKRQVPALGAVVCALLPQNSQHNEAKWPLGEREPLAACFLFHDDQLLAIRWRASAVGSRCPLRGAALETSWNWNALRSQEARKCPTVARCHEPFSFSGTWPGGNVEGCNGTPGGNRTHTAADCGPAPQEPHAIDSSL